MAMRHRTSLEPYGFVRVPWAVAIRSVGIISASELVPNRGAGFQHAHLLARFGIAIEAETSSPGRLKTCSTILRSLNYE